MIYKYIYISLLDRRIMEKGYNQLMEGRVINKICASTLPICSSKILQSILDGVSPKISDHTF